MSIFRNDVSSNYFIDGTCSELAFFDTIDNTIMFVDEASEIVNEKSFGEVVKDIKDGIVKLFNKFIETVKGLWQKFINSITKFFEEHNLGTLIGNGLDKSLDNISDDTIKKANEILSKSKVWSKQDGYIPVPQDIYELVNTDPDKLLLDADKVIGDGALINKINSDFSKVSGEVCDVYWKGNKIRAGGEIDENDLNADINICNNHVNEFKDYVSKYSVSFKRKSKDIFTLLVNKTSYFKGLKEISKDTVRSNINAIKNSVRITNAIKQNYNNDIRRIKNGRNNVLKSIKTRKKNTDSIYSKNSLVGRIESLYLRFISIALKFNYIKKKEAINIVSFGVKTSCVAATRIIAFLKKVESGKISDEELIKYADDKLYGIPQKIIAKMYIDYKTDQVIKSVVDDVAKSFNNSNI